MRKYEGQTRLQLKDIYLCFEFMLSGMLCNKDI